MINIPRLGMSRHLGKRTAGNEKGIPEETDRCAWCELRAIEDELPIPRDGIETNASKGRTRVANAIEASLNRRAKS